MKEDNNSKNDFDEIAATDRRLISKSVRMETLGSEAGHTAEIEASERLSSVFTSQLKLKKYETREKNTHCYKMNQ